MTAISTDGHRMPGGAHVADGAGGAVPASDYWPVSNADALAACQEGLAALAERDIRIVEGA